MKGYTLAIVIREEEYILGVESCNHNFHGWFVWPKGSNPLTVIALKAKLMDLWKCICKWGYFEFAFSSLEDVRRYWLINSWNINHGFLKLFPCRKYFNPSHSNKPLLMFGLE